MDVYISKYAAGYLIKYSSICFIFSLSLLMIYLFLFKSKESSFQFKKLLKKDILLTAYDLTETRFFNSLFRVNQICFFLLIFAVALFFLRVYLI